MTKSFPPPKKNKQTKTKIKKGKKISAILNYS